MNYDLAIEFRGCSKEDSEFCLYKMSNKSCEDALNKCHYPMKSNPLCMCNKIDECNGSYRIEKFKDKIYIIYFCTKCHKFIKDFKGAGIQLLKKLDSKYIYYGKDLKKLVDKIIPKDEVISDIQLMVEYFEHAFKSLNTRM